jgi:flagellar biosynthesis chaperone FliJ
MAFLFALATVMRVRESIEQREECALQKIQLEMARVARQIEELTEAMAKAHVAREQALKRTMPGGELQSMLWQVQTAVEGKKTLLVTLQGLEEMRLQQMKVYQAAHRDHETMINMCNEQREVYEIEQARSQQKYLDDIFMARRHRG